MDNDEKTMWGLITFIVVLTTLFVMSWVSVNSRVNNAHTKSELREACSGLSIKNAPVRCLELGK